MNERIRGLAEQAGMGHERWNTTVQFESFLEKFAEFIVRECISCLNDGSKQAGDVRTTVGTVEKTLKQHFGV